MTWARRKEDVKRVKKNADTRGTTRKKTGKHQTRMGANWDNSSRSDKKADVPGWRQTWWQKDKMRE